MATVGFEWDPSKDLANQAKHGISFSDAKYAFDDPRRVIAEVSRIAPSLKSDISVSASWATVW